MNHPLYISLYDLRHSRQVLKLDTRETTQEMLICTHDSRSVGVNWDRLVSGSNKPPCDSTLTGGPDNATDGRQNKSGLLAQNGYRLFCSWQSQNQ